MLSRRKIRPRDLPDAVKAKWSPDVLDEGFVPLPKRLLRCLPRVFEGSHALEDLAVVLAIIDYRRPNLARPPSLEYLAFVAGIDPGVFKKRLEELTERGWLKREGPDESVTIEIEGLLERIGEETQEQ